MEAMQKLQVRHVVEMTGTVSLSAVSFLQRRSLSHYLRPNGLRPGSRARATSDVQDLRCGLTSQAQVDEAFRSLPWHIPTLTLDLWCSMCLSESWGASSDRQGVVALSVGAEMASQTTSWRHVREPCSVRKQANQTLSNIIKLHLWTSMESIPHIIPHISSYFPHHFRKNSALWMREEVAYITPVSLVRSTSQSPMLIE